MLFCWRGSNSTWKRTLWIKDRDTKEATVTVVYTNCHVGVERVHMICCIVVARQSTVLGSFIGPKQHHPTSSQVLICFLIVIIQNAATHLNAIWNQFSIGEMCLGEGIITPGTNRIGFVGESVSAWFLFVVVVVVAGCCLRVLFCDKQSPVGMRKQTSTAPTKSSLTNRKEWLCWLEVIWNEKQG